MKYKGMIGLMDSGVGGISVLKECVKLLPQENFIFYGDSANAPYGEKPVETVQALTERVVDYLFKEGVKAVVIACNTATSAAVKYLRDKYPEKIIVGVEPALKPAVKANHHDILVMATANTLKLEKFKQLESTYAEGINVIPCACNGLAMRVEQGRLDDPDLIELLESLVGQYKGKADCGVLGCTHYPLIEKQIKEVLGDIDYYDSGLGTAKELKRQLKARGLLNTDSTEGSVTFESSHKTDEELKLYEMLFQS